MGHAGTLDPTASGVLPVCLGKATRVIQFLMNVTKTYRAEIELGVSTDTFDASGKIVQRGDSSGISREQLEAALASFRGLIQQIPPMYSAVKYHGQSLYELARAGIQVERKSRPANIYRLELIDLQPPVVTVGVECGKGTYIRSLAYDLGQQLGCGAFLKSLVRLRYGIFDIKDAVSLSEIEAAFRHGYWQRFIHPIDSVLSGLTAVMVDEVNEDIIKHGGSPVFETEEVGEYCRAYNLDGRFLAVLRFNAETGRWQSYKVFV